MKDSGAKDSVKSTKMLTLPLTLVKIKTVLNGTHLAPGIFGFHIACSGRHRTKLKQMLLVAVTACNATTAQRTALQQRSCWKRRSKSAMLVLVQNMALAQTRTDRKS